MGQTCEKCTETEKERGNEDIYVGNTQPVNENLLLASKANRVHGSDENTTSSPETNKNVNQIQTEELVKESEREVEANNDIKIRTARIDSDQNDNVDFNMASSKHMGSEIKIKKNKKSMEYTLADKSIFIGELVNGLPENYGKQIMPNGDEYVGYFIRGKRNGTGRFFKENGYVYHGDFENNRINGYGVMTWPNGDEYTGQFKNNQYHGQGTLKRATGEIRIGEWAFGNLVEGQS